MKHWFINTSKSFWCISVLFTCLSMTINIIIAIFVIHLFLSFLFILFSNDIRQSFELWSYPYTSISCFRIISILFLWLNQTWISFKNCLLFIISNIWILFIRVLAFSRWIRSWLRHKYIFILIKYWTWLTWLFWDFRNLRLMHQLLLLLLQIYYCFIRVINLFLNRKTLFI